MFAIHAVMHPVRVSVHVLLQTFGSDGVLLQRGSGRVWVTEAGQLFLGYVQSILTAATEATKAMQDFWCACG